MSLKVISLLWVVCLALIVSLPAIAKTEANIHPVVHLGVSPWTKPQLLHAWIEPMRARLERASGHAFIISSAADLKQYLFKAIKGKYTVAEMPMHMSLYLIKYHDFIPVSFARAGVRTYIITLRDKGVDSLADLKGEPYLLPDPLAIVSFMTKEALSGFSSGHFQHSKNHWSVIRFLMEGRFKAGSVLSPMYDGLAESVKKQFKVLHRSSFEFDGMYLMHPDSDQKTRNNIGRILNGFTPSTKSIVHRIDPVKQEEIAYWFSIMGKYADQIHEQMKSSSAADNHVRF